MTKIKITREDFTIPRTPSDLAAYVRETYNYIYQDRNLKYDARLRKAPFKTFLEELMPFSRYCIWKYGARDDVLCALVQGTPGQGTPGHDAIVIDRETGSEHEFVEITFPIDGQELHEEGRQLNERGITNFKGSGVNDISRQQSAIDRTLRIAKKKILRNYRDYRLPGGSSLIILFDHLEFWDSIPKHAELLRSLQRELSLLNFQADDVFLMFTGDIKVIVPVAFK